VQATTAALVAIGLVVGALRPRAGLFLLSVLGAGFCYWYLPHLNRGYVETGLDRALNTRGIETRAVVLAERWTQPQALFWLFRGGGGHPLQIRVLRVRFHTEDGAVRQVQFEEIYKRLPPTISIAELQRGLRPGATLPIRYLPSIPCSVRTRTYLESPQPGAAATLRSILIAPLALSVALVLCAISGRPTTRAAKATKP
jgi:hypothetical protein